MCNLKKFYSSIILFSVCIAISSIVNHKIDNGGAKLWYSTIESEYIVYGCE